MALIGEAFPDREVVGVPGAIISFGGGGPHCVTQQIPPAPSWPDRRRLPWTAGYGITTRFGTGPALPARTVGSGSRARMVVPSQGR